LKLTLGSTNLYITSTSKLTIIVIIARYTVTALITGKSLRFTAVNRSDFPVIKAVTVYLAILTMIINLLVDVMYKFVDPRVSFK
jgi:ABC-type microcin C transport system permease subunit YejB